MTEQTKAQRLADLLIDDADCMEDEIKRNPMLFGGSADCSLPGMQKAAAELRRLDALNAELVEALEEAEFVLDNNPMVYPEKSNAIARARVTLAKAKEQT